MISSSVTFFIILLYASLIYVLYDSRSVFFVRQNFYTYVLSFFTLLIYHYPLDECEHIGHESFYFELSLGVQSLQAHDTLHYPSQQVLWWFAHFLPIHDFIPVLPLVISALVPIIFSLICNYDSSPKRFLPAILWSLTLPSFLDWSCSFYNIVPPLLFALLFVLGLQKNNMKLSMISGLLMLGGRIEWVVVVPFIFCSSLCKKKQGILTTLLLLWLCLLIFIFDQDIPGEGERWQAFIINLPILSYLEIYSNIGFLLLCASLFYRQTLSLRSSISLISWCIAVHFLMSSFNDYGSRHIFPIWFVIGFIIIRSENIWFAAVLLHIIGVFQHHKIHYASHDIWKNHLTQFSSSKKLSLSEAGNCARIAESDFFKQKPTLSHFNLYSIDEYNRLQESFGCVHWCLEYEQWRWTSLGVSDRNSRINEMYNTRIIGTLEQEEQSCVLYEVYK